MTIALGIATAHDLGRDGRAVTEREAGGLNTYSLNHWWDGGGQYDNTHCFPYVTVEVQVVWTDNTYSIDERSSAKPVGAGQTSC